MNGVPSYQVIEFLNWLYYSDERISSAHDRQRLYELAEEFVARYRYGFYRNHNRDLNNEERHRIPLGNGNESIGDAAYRLVDTLFHTIKYDDISEVNTITIITLFTQCLKHNPHSPELKQIIRFLEWLDQNYDGKININKTIPNVKLKKIVTDFCQQLNYPDTEEFYKTLQKLQKGHVDTEWLIYIFPFLRKTKDSKNRNLSLKYLLGRYRSVKFNGIFLFEKNDNFPKFINDYWEDLHYLTGNYMDIYYSFHDLKDPISGYQISSTELRYLDVKLTDIPAFMLWSGQIKNNVTIPLYQLSHGDIFQIIKHIVQGIKDEKSIQEIAIIAKQETQKRRNNLFHHTQRAMGIVINGGEKIIMVGSGDHYEVSGQAGAVGRNATASNNTFIQVKQELESAHLDTEAWSKLQQLANRLTTEKLSDDVSQSTVYEAVGKLLAIKEASEKQNQEEQAKAITNWRQWFSGIGDKAKEYLSITADTVSLGVPLLKLLGLTIPFSG